MFLVLIIQCYKWGNANLLADDTDAGYPVAEADDI